VQAPLEVSGARIKGSGRLWQIAGTDPKAHNDPDQPPRVVIEERKLTGVREQITVAPCSITLFAFEAE
jgi:hypothetical protein